MLLFDTSALIEIEGELAAARIGPFRAFLGRHRAEDLACSQDANSPRAVRNPGA